MGGDDLGSDEEFAFSSVATVAPTKVTLVAAVKKRKNAGPKGGVERQDDDVTWNEASGKAKRQRLLNRQIEYEAPDQQAAFLEEKLKEYIRVKLNSNPTGMFELKPAYFCSSKKESLLERLKDVVSAKSIKSWKNSSPCVIVVCISARRSVEILKDLTPLKSRVAKLFPKNGSVKEQIEQLSSSSFGVAVGTPHRLNALAECCEPGLFSKTKLVVFDCYISQKQYTVCTLPDTAFDCMKLIHEHLNPKLRDRNDMRIAFL